MQKVPLVKIKGVSDLPSPLEGFCVRVDIACNIPLALMGVLAPRLRMLDGPLSPPLALVEFSRRTCLQSCLQTSPPTPKKSYLKFQNCMTSLSGYIGLIGGYGVSLKIFPVGIFLLMLLWSQCKILEPYWSERSTCASATKLPLY